MSGVWAFARLDVRRRWRLLVVLALLVAFSGGTAMAAFAGARRGESSLDRLLAETRPATAMVQPNFGTIDFDPIEELSYVEALSRYVLASTPAIDGVDPEAMDFPPLDETTMASVERPVVLAGRGYDPDADDEAVVTERFRARYGLGVDDTVRLHLATPAQVDQRINQVTPADELVGPVLTVRIVGVVRTSLLELPDDEGRISLSPAIAEAHLANLTGSKGYAPVNALVRLERGAADLPRLRADIRRISGLDDVDVIDLTARHERALRGLRFEAGWLAGFGMAAALAALVLVGQAVARYAGTTADELSTGRALGMSPLQRRLAAASTPAAAGALGASLGGVLAAMVSPWFPIGRAADLEPAPGIDLDPLVLATGMVTCFVAVAAIAFGAAGLAERDAGQARRRSLLASAEVRLGLPVALVMGARFALERGRGRTALPVLPVHAAVVVGVTGVVAVVTVAAGVDDASAHPERFGQHHQVVAWVGGDGEDLWPAADLAPWLEARDDVRAVYDIRAGVANRPGGRGSVTLWTRPDRQPPLRTTVLQGRMPETPDEVALAPGTRRALQVGLGDEVPLTGTEGERSLTLVGTAFVVTGPASSYDEGGWVTNEGFDRLFERFLFHFLLATATRDDDGLADRIDQALLADDDTAVWATQVGTPGTEDLDAGQQLEDLSRVRTLPLALGGFLALLAAAAIAHSLLVAVRRRAHDLAVLRALGETPAGCRTAVCTQAVVLVLLGLALGLPLGVAAGRTLWREVADYVPLEYLAPPVLGTAGPAAAGALAVAVLLALGPAHRAARWSPADILRTE